MIDGTNQGIQTPATTHEPVCDEVLDGDLNMVTAKKKYNGSSSTGGDCLRGDNGSGI
jgi:hypothetical protein